MKYHMMCIHLPSILYGNSVPFIQSTIHDNAFKGLTKDWMLETAKFIFKIAPSVDLVKVWEHGGWWLTYAEDRSMGVYDRFFIVDSANDKAVYGGKTKILRDKFLRGEVEEKYMDPLRLELTLCE